jgi:hypothetical protein
MNLKLFGDVVEVRVTLERKAGLFDHSLMMNPVGIRQQYSCWNFLLDKVEAES